MKKRLLLGLGTLAATAACAQQTELSLHLTSGGAAFRGASAASTSFLNISDVNSIPSYTIDPYGSRPGVAYGVAGQVQRDTKNRLLVGAQAGYEVLNSRVSISNVFTHGSDAGTSVSGHTTLANHFINLHPFIGHRFLVSKVDLDLTAGPELGLLRRSHETGEASNDSYTYTTDLDRSKSISADLRARLNLTAYYQRFGLALGYSRGFSNYKSGYVGGVNEAYLQAFRVGVVYRMYGI